MVPGRMRVAAVFGVLSPGGPACKRMGFHCACKFIHQAALDALTARHPGLPTRMHDAPYSLTWPHLFFFVQSGQDLAELERCSLEMGTISDEMDSLSERWLELAELAGDL